MSRFGGFVLGRGGGVFRDRKVKQAEFFAVGGGLVLETAEEGRSGFLMGKGFVTVQIPEQRLAGCPRAWVLFRAPKRPERGVVAFDALAASKIGFEQGGGLQA